MAAKIKCRGNEAKVNGAMGKVCCLEAEYGKLLETPFPSPPTTHVFQRQEEREWAMIKMDMHRDKVYGAIRKVCVVQRPKMERYWKPLYFLPTDFQAKKNEKDDG